MTKKYREPNLVINKIYTRKGDSGNTFLVGGKKVSKDALRVVCYGEIDELIVLIGGVLTHITHLDNNDNFKKLYKKIDRIQNELFNIGNMLATIDGDISENMPQVDLNHIQNLEDEIDIYNNKLPSLKSFVLPGGSQINIWFHLARTTCRRCERLVVKLSNKEQVDTIIVKYLNRLSDFLFTCSRWVNYELSINETLWNPNKE